MVSKKVVRSPRKVAVQGYSSLFLFFGGVPMSMKEIVLISLIVLLRGFPCFHVFSHGAALYPHSE